MVVILMQGDIMAMAIVSSPTFIELLKNMAGMHLAMSYCLKI